MANNSPTIVAASLSDDQLKKSIESLVTHVDEAMKKMVQSTNNAVGEMEAKLKSLGNLKIDSNGTADGGASKRAKSQNAETDAVEKNVAARDKQIKKNQEVAMSFDQMAKAQRQAVSPTPTQAPQIKSARESYLAFVQGFKAQGEAIERQIKDAEAALNKAVENRVNELNAKLTNAKAKLNELNVELAKQRMNAERTGNYSTYNAGITRTTQAIEYKMKHIAELQRQISQGAVPSNYEDLLAKITALRKEHERVSNIMKEDVTTRQQSTSATQQQLTTEQKLTEEIRKQAQAIRSSKEWQEKGHVVIGDVNYYDKERANVSKRDKQLLLSLEEQIVQAQQNEAEAARKAAQETQRQAEAQRHVQQSALGTARIIESVHEMQKRANGLIGKGKSVPTFAVELESAKRLSDRLKELREQYNNMNFGQRIGREGQAVAQQIREITRQGQILNNQLNRPTKKEVFGLSEKTLDDIAYKMLQLSAYRGGLDASKQSKEIAQVNDEYNRLKKRMDEVMQKNQQMIASNTALGRSWNYMKNRLAFYFTVGASTQFIKNLIEVRSQYEMNERALGILVNSAERGTQIFNELSQMALVSPYTLIELSAAAKQLTAYDVAAKDVVDTTRRLADMAAAVGIPIERLTYALGQIKAYGYLNARDARMFANAGIPLVKQLSEYYTELEGRLVSTADIYDRIKKKSIGYEEVTSVIAKMTDEGGKFYDFQAKMAETLKVQLANLTLAWNNMLNAMGEESQGVLVAGIGTLKQVFLHWKDIEHVLYELVVVLGAYKAYQIITTRLMGATAASLDAQVLAMKRNRAAMLEKQALTRKLTIDELRQVAAQNQVTAADYRNALSGKQLTKQKALLLVALNKNNAQLKAAVVNMGLLTTQEVANITVGKALAIVFKSIGISIRNAALAIKAFMASMWPLLVLGALYELYHAWDSYGEHVKEVNRQAAEHAKEAFENIKQYLESDVTSALQDRLAKGGKVESDAAGQKAWDEMREKIELSSSASNAFIAKLMQINDINERLSAGFDYLEDIQRVAGVMQTLEEDAVNISSTTLGGLFGEGLKDDLEDFVNAYQKYVSLNENLRQGGVGEKYFDDQKRALEEFRGEVEKTTTSLYNIASKEGFNTNEQREFFEREISEIAQAEEMGAKETRIFRMQAEKEYYAYARAQLVSQLEYQDGAQKALTQKRINDLDNEFGTNKALQESFFTWLTEKQDHAVKNMLRGKTQEEIKQGEWLKGSNAKWVEEMARKFSKEYGVSFDDLHRLVLNANTWSINIPVFFQTIGQPLSDVQRDYEARTGKKFSSNPLIKDAKTQVEILDILKKKQKEVANEMATAEKAGGKYWEDNKQRYKEENDALVADIHAYNALTDAEEKANKKNNKGSKKDPLLDALKQEISLVEKLQGDYDKLSKSGASQADALDTIRGAYGKTIRLLNTQLQSYGLPQINISQLITGKDPNKALAHFKQTLDTLVSKGMLTLERSKELEAVVEKFTLSAKTYNLDMITKGLNNELGKLKDEYELAVELDANPELGGMFADWMDIDVNDLPRTAKEYAERASNELNKYLKQNKADVELPNLLNVTDDDLSAFEENKILTDEQLEIVRKGVQQARDIHKKEVSDQIKDWDKLLEKYAEYEYKVSNIQKEAEKERKTAREKNAPKEIFDAIDNRERRKIAKVQFEEFQKYPEWIMATGELSGMTNKAIGGLIKSLEKYKKSAKNLDPKQIKNINNALKNLYKEQRKNNPFGAIANMLDKANERMADVKPEMEAIMSDIIALEEEIGDGKATKEQIKTLEDLKNRWKDLAAVGDISAGEWVESIMSVYGAVKGAISLFDDLAKAIGGKNASDIERVFGVLDKAGSGAQIGSVFGGYGAAIGAAIGGITGVLTEFADELSGNSDITKAVNESTKSVSQLELAYIDLEQAVDRAMGTAVIGARQATLANKELQLAEIKRQIELEKSRKSKNRDEDKILELQKQYRELMYEIQNGYREIVDDLMGTDVSSFAENLVSSMIDAFKEGEDYMKIFNDKFNEMIDNMIMKSIVSRVVSKYLDQIWSNIDDRINARSKQESEDWAKAQNNAARLNEMTDKEVAREIAVLRSINGSHDYYKELENVTSADIEAYRKAALLEEKAAKERFDAATEFADSDIDYIMSRVTEVMPELGEKLKEILGQYYRFGESSDKNLSALQQGIQGITEDTAGALEAYMNGVSQQVYLQSEYLRRIAEVMTEDANPNDDIEIASLSQILLQLQQSYTVQQSIQSILEGVLNPSGRAFSVELIS